MYVITLGLLVVNASDIQLPASKDVASIGLDSLERANAKLTGRFQQCF